MNSSAVLTEFGRRRSAAGFTLIEVIIVVVIVGILMAVALPTYQNSLRKARRADGTSALLEVTNRQEQLMLDRNTYTTDMTQLGFAASPMISEEGHYSIAGAACGGGTIATCYVLTASPVTGGLQTKDERCTSFILDSTGAKTATGTTADECW